MNNWFSKIAISFLVLLTTIGAGCGKSSEKSESKNNGSGNSQTETKDVINPKDTFNDTVEVEMNLTDAKLIKTEQKIKSILKDIFGKVKLNSYFSGISGTGSLIAEYTANRVTKAVDISLLADALKKEGYKAEMVGVNSGSATGLFDGKEYNILISYNVDGQIVSVQYTPNVSLPQTE